MEDLFDLSQPQCSLFESLCFKVTVTLQDKTQRKQKVIVETVSYICPYLCLTPHKSL